MATAFFRAADGHGRTMTFDTDANARAFVTAFDGHAAVVGGGDA